MELRDEIADVIFHAGHRYFSDPHELNYRPALLAIAEEILLIPRVAQALKLTVVKTMENR